MGELRKPTPTSEKPTEVGVVVQPSYPALPPFIDSSADMQLEQPPAQGVDFGVRDENLSDWVLDAITGKEGETKTDSTPEQPVDTINLNPTLTPKKIKDILGDPQVVERIEKSFPLTSYALTLNDATAAWNGHTLSQPDCGPVSPTKTQCLGAIRISASNRDLNPTVNLQTGHIYQLAHGSHVVQVFGYQLHPQLSSSEAATHPLTQFNNAFYHLATYLGVEQPALLDQLLDTEGKKKIINTWQDLQNHRAAVFKRGLDIYAQFAERATFIGVSKADLAIFNQVIDGYMQALMKNPVSPVVQQLDAQRSPAVDPLLRYLWDHYRFGQFGDPMEAIIYVCQNPKQIYEQAGANTENEPWLPTIQALKEQWPAYFLTVSKSTSPTKPASVQLDETPDQWSQETRRIETSVEINGDPYKALNGLGYTPNHTPETGEVDPDTQAAIKRITDQALGIDMDNIFSPMDGAIKDLAALVHVKGINVLKAPGLWMPHASNTPEAQMVPGPILLAYFQSQAGEQIKLIHLLESQLNQDPIKLEFQSSNKQHQRILDLILLKAFEEPRLITPGKLKIKMLKVHNTGRMGMAEATCIVEALAIRDENGRLLNEPAATRTFFFPFAQTITTRELNLTATQEQSYLESLTRYNQIGQVLKLRELKPADQRKLGDKEKEFLKTYSALSSDELNVQRQAAYDVVAPVEARILEASLDAWEHPFVKAVGRKLIQAQLTMIDSELTLAEVVRVRNGHSALNKRVIIPLTVASGATVLVPPVGLLATVPLTLYGVSQFRKNSLRADKVTLEEQWQVNGTWLSKLGYSLGFIEDQDWEYKARRERLEAFLGLWETMITFHLDGVGWLNLHDVQLYNLYIEDALKKLASDSPAAQYLLAQRFQAVASPARFFESFFDPKETHRRYLGESTLSPKKARHILDQMRNDRNQTQLMNYEMGVVANYFAVRTMNRQAKYRDIAANAAFRRGATQTAIKQLGKQFWHDLKNEWKPQVEAAAQEGSKNGTAAIKAATREGVANGKAALGAAGTELGQTLNGQKKIGPNPIHLTASSSTLNTSPSIAPGINGGERSLADRRRRLSDEESTRPAHRAQPETANQLPIIEGVQPELIDRLLNGIVSLYIDSVPERSRKSTPIGVFANESFQAYFEEGDITLKRYQRTALNEILRQRLEKRLTEEQLMNQDQFTVRAARLQESPSPVIYTQTLMAQDAERIGRELLATLTTAPLGEQIEAYFNAQQSLSIPVADRPQVANLIETFIHTVQAQTNNPFVSEISSNQ